MNAMRRDDQYRPFAGLDAVLKILLAPERIVVVETHADSTSGSHLSYCVPRVHELFFLYSPATESEPGGILAGASIADGRDELVHLGGSCSLEIMPQKRGGRVGLGEEAMSGREDGTGAGHHAIIM